MSIEKIDKEKYNAILDKAKNILYGDNFESMTDVFKKAGKDDFADAMGLVVTGVLQKLEKDDGEMDEYMLVVVGMSLVAMIASDMSEGGVVPDLQPEDIQLAIIGVVSKWTKQNMGRIDTEKALAAMQGQGGGSPEQGMPQEQGMPPGGMMQQAEAQAAQMPPAGGM